MSTYKSATPSGDKSERSDRNNMIFGWQGNDLGIYVIDGDCRSESDDCNIVVKASCIV